MNLRVARPDGAFPKEMLLTDISGEHFLQVRDSTEEARRLRAAGRSSVFVLFLDAGRLGDLVQRHAAAADSRQILHSFVDAGVIGPANAVDFVISRADLVDKPHDSAEWRFIYSVVEDLRERFGGKVGDTRVWRVAARPSAGYDAAEGIDELFSAWCGEEHSARYALPLLYSESSDADFESRIPWPRLEQSK